jgi:ATP-binding cassette subfamily A (ABC1) protein 3
VLPSLSNGSVDLLVSPGEACIMLVVDVVLYVIVGNYIYAINPGEYGVPKHPLFFIRWIWVKKEQVRNVDVTVKSLNQSENDRVVLQNLSKYFGSQRDTPSVDNLSITIRRGEIYALLGHNGAGKTTTMSILTGMITPTSYDVASVDGYDIHEDMDRIRQTVGLCPQFDVLFGDLSARDHLLMFAGIKGVQNAEALVQTLLDDLELPVTNQRADTFSGGMKRRLSVGNAIVGGATLLFLDEPSSGMDPSVASPDVGPAEAPARDGQDDRAHDTLHGRGRLPRRPHRDHGQGPPLLLRDKLRAEAEVRHRLQAGCGQKGPVRRRQ